MALVTLPALGTPGATADDAGPPRPETAIYRRPLGNDPATLDPARASDVYSLAVSQQIFDGLVQFDRTLTATPALAQVWQGSRDGLSWTFTLRRGVRFHHGRELTADDVVFSLTRLVDPATRSPAAEPFQIVKGATEFREGRAARITGLAALDRYTLQITLGEAPVPLPALLATGPAKIVPRDLVERDPEGFGTRPIGTGPFRFVRWDRGREIQLDRNPDYFDGPPRLGRLIFRVFAGGQVDRMFQEFQEGHLEDSPLPSREAHEVLANPRHHYVRRSMFSLRHYGLNTRVRPLDDRRVRQALIHALDRESLVVRIAQGRHTLARGIVPPGTPGFNPELRGYAHDPARARELLSQAGYAGGRGLPVLPIWSSVKHDGIVREHEQMGRDLEAVGVRAEFHYRTEWPVFSRLMREGQLPVFLRAWYADIPDPHNFLFELFYSRSPRNYTGYQSPTVDQLLLQARQETHPVRRADLYRRAEEQILEDAPVIPIWHYSYERLFQSYVRNVEVSGLGDPYIPFRKVWLESPR